MKEKVIKLHYYFHDIVSGNSPTARDVAKPMSYISLTGFGNVVMDDDVLTSGPEPNYTVVGRAQGICIDLNGGSWLPYDHEFCFH